MRREQRKQVFRRRTLRDDPVLPLSSARHSARIAIMRRLVCISRISTACALPAIAAESGVALFTEHLQRWSERTRQPVRAGHPESGAPGGYAVVRDRRQFDLKSGDNARSGRDVSLLSIRLPSAPTVNADSVEILSQRPRTKRCRWMRCAEASRPHGRSPCRRRHGTSAADHGHAAVQCRRLDRADGRRPRDDRYRFHAHHVSRSAQRAPGNTFAALGHCREEGRRAHVRDRLSDASVGVARRVQRLAGQWRMPPGTVRLGADRQPHRHGFFRCAG
jgi:hypothetical protein